MEPFLTVKCIKSLKDKGLDVKTLVMDDDSTTFVRVKKAVSDQLKKCSDISHILRNFSNSLYKVRDVHKTYLLLTSMTSRNVSVMPLSKIKVMRENFAKIY